MKNRITGNGFFSGWVVDFLSYNRAEQRGILVLCVALFLVITANLLIPGSRMVPPPDYSLFEQEVREFETEWKRANDSVAAARLQKFRNNQSRYGFFSIDTTKTWERKARNAVVIELNSADTFDLQRLRGIGSAFARRIVSYRKRLGGFCDKRQLLEVFGMDSARYNGISGQVWTNPDSIHQIDLNHVLFKELLRHPYFPFEITKAIMVYRQKNKTFKTISELLQVDGINDSIFKKIEIYVKADP